MCLYERKLKSFPECNLVGVRQIFCKAHPGRTQCTPSSVRVYTG